MADKPRGLQVAAYRYNCQPCKQRKTKCDRVKPCASCHLRGTQDKCYIDEHDGADSPTTSEMATEHDRPPKKARISNAKSTTKAIATSSSRQSLPSTSAAVLSPSLQHDQTTAVQEHIAMLRRTIDQLEASILPAAPSQKQTPSSSSSSYYYHDHAASPPGVLLTTNDRLVWADVAHLFPPKRDVERILEYFLRDMVYLMIPVQEKQLWRAWMRLTSTTPPAVPAWADADSELYEPGISRPMVASLLLCLASTSFMIPQRREEELELTRGMEEQRDQWVTSALALGRCGAIYSNAEVGPQPWLHYIDSIADASLDRFGFETLAVRISALLGMTETSYHLVGESLRRALRINLYDESAAKASDLFHIDDPELTDDEVVQMRRRIGAQLVIIERWSCLYAARTPMIDEEAEVLPLPTPGYLRDSEEVSLDFSRFVSKIRLLPAQLTALTTRKPGDWSTQRTRDQEAVQRILDIDRGLCGMYDPTQPRPHLGGRSHSSILADLPDILERNQHLDVSDAHINQLHREFADALIMTSSWLSLRCLVTSNLMFLPWVPDVTSRYYALNLARRLIELLPSIWMMASSPYVPFSSSWISRHLFLACTVLSVPILGQEPSAAASAAAGKTGELQPGARQEEDEPDRGSDFAPSRMQSKHFFNKLSTPKPADANSTRLPASSSVDLDWFSSKLVEIASLFSKLAERGDQTAGFNTKLIHALLNGRAELRDRVLDKLGQKQKSLPATSGEMGGLGGRFESQRDLTAFVMAPSIGKSSPSSGSTGTSPATGPAASPSSAGRGGYGAAGIGWDWDKAFFPPTPAGGKAAGAGGGDVLANVPMLLDTQDWLAILDGVDIPL
uniref:Zn(2)-C6 fungal-type domain-containing protein n=1 Tax=Kalmanozyma brasiliensis (strain GHG001) TaxID=1365824 RepID=V5GHC9_KALBG